MALKNLDLHGDTQQEPPQQSTVFRTVTAETLDIHSELLDNYNAALALRETLPYRDDVPPNQIAQIMNSMTTILTQLTKLQTELYSSQRIKDIELILIETLKSMPQPMQDKFFDLYTKKFPQDVR